jgi:CRP-like cAMP-binding protein
MQYRHIAPHKTVNFFTFAMANRPLDDIDKSALLRKSWLAGFSSQIIDEAAACGVLRAVADGTLLHARGAKADGVYTIARGAVRFTRTTADGHATTIGVLEAPRWFGDISLFDGLPRTHDAHAAGPCVVMFHSKTDFRRLLANHPQILEHFARILSLRLRATFDMVEEAAIAPLPQRLARRLLEFAQLKISPFNETALAPAGARDVPLTQEELGQLLGKSRQSIAKLLRAWENDGLVQAKYGRISIRQPEALTRLAYPEREPSR